MTDALPFDVRAGMTSASNAHADDLCPGRHFAQRGVPLPPESKDAKAGTLVHKAFAGENVELDRQQRRTFNRGRYLEFEMVRRFFNEPLADDQILAMAHRNQRYWLHQRGIPVHSGEVDALWFARDFKAALIEDQKALFGDVQDATDNMQLRDYVCLVWENFPEVERIDVFINQPNVRWKIEDQLLVSYELDAIRRSHSDMTARVVRSNSIDGPRIPGLEQCKFCRAAGTPRCPESQGYMIAGASARISDTATAADRGKWLLDLKASEKMIKTALAAAKEALKGNAGWADGWMITDGKTTREFTSSLEVLRRAREYFADDPDAATEKLIQHCAKISVPKLEDWFAEVGGEGAAETFKLLFESLIEKGVTEGSLARVKADKKK